MVSKRRPTIERKTTNKMGRQHKCVQQTFFLEKLIFFLQLFFPGGTSLFRLRKAQSVLPYNSRLIRGFSENSAVGADDYALSNSLAFYFIKLNRSGQNFKRN
ncbi:hypothetical protein EVAR_85848_1 [Eumeta japonica]|uniref:Uncharacterized protein n=1 Tax=Eumeta variegata TaxID=151549 RepID=A0A4C1UQP6_EUMVA|nr:hypothetical protein EVAR_85848_1 [Eumeta japonica]